MTDTSAPQAPNEGQNGATPAGLRVLGQYVKDLSFENPGHTPVQSQPNIDLGIDVGATPHADGNGIYEVSLKLSAKAVSDGTVLFITELDYAGLFQLQNVPQAQLEPLLLIECPRLLFPFARRIIAERDLRHAACDTEVSGNIWTVERESWGERNIEDLFFFENVSK